MPIGGGFAPGGTTPGGFGIPDVAGPIQFVPLIDPSTGIRQSGRFIDPKTKDYRFLPDGRLQGMPTVMQMVQLAVLTTLGSSAQTTLGIDLTRVRDKNDSFAQAVTSTATDALAPIVKQGLIKINSIQVFGATPGELPNPDAGIGIVNFTDLTTNTPQTISF